MTAGNSTMLVGMQVRKVLAAQQQLPKHQTTSIESLQNLTGLGKRTVTSALQACRLRELSLEAATTTSTPAGKAQDRTPLVDQISSSETLGLGPDLDDPLADACVAETLMEGALQQLPHEEAKVLHLVYGLQDGLPKSRPQVSHAALPQKVYRQTAASFGHSYMHLWAVPALHNVAAVSTLQSCESLAGIVVVHLVVVHLVLKIVHDSNLWQRICEGVAQPPSAPSSSVALNAYIVHNLLGACLVSSESALLKCFYSCLGLPLCRLRYAS